MVVAGHLRALVPGQGPTRLGRQREHGERQRLLQCLRTTSAGKVDQLDVAARPVDQGADRGLDHPSRDQVALPIAHPNPGLDNGGPAIDERSGRNEPRCAFLGTPTTFTQRPTGAQPFGELPAQPALPAVIDGLVDRLVADPFEKEVERITFLEGNSNQRHALCFEPVGSVPALCDD
jgi:hypothetical protein